MDDTERIHALTPRFSRSHARVRAETAAMERDTMPPVRFEIVFLTAAVDEPRVLRSTTDPNTATLAFHEELVRLTIRKATGELILCKPTTAHAPLLRQPLSSGQTPEPTHAR
jgi:hypothetical protein